MTHVSWVTVMLIVVALWLGFNVLVVYLLNRAGQTGKKIDN